MLAAVTFLLMVLFVGEGKEQPLVDTGALVTGGG